MLVLVLVFGEFDAECNEPAFGVNPADCSGDGDTGELDSCGGDTDVAGDVFFGLLPTLSPPPRIKLSSHSCSLTTRISMLELGKFLSLLLLGDVDIIFVMLNAFFCARSC